MCPAFPLGFTVEGSVQYRGTGYVDRIGTYIDAGAAPLWAIEHAIEDLQNHATWIAPNVKPKILLSCSKDTKLTERSVSGIGID